MTFSPCGRVMDLCQIAKAQHGTGSPTLKTVVERVKGVVQSAVANADIPFYQVVDAANVARSSAYLPIFQVQITVASADGEAPVVGKAQKGMGGLAVEELPVRSATIHRATCMFLICLWRVCFCLCCAWSGSNTYKRGLLVLKMSASVQVGASTAQMDITLDLVEEEDTISGTLEYATDLLTRNSMERMAGHLEVSPCMCSLGRTYLTRHGCLDVPAMPVQVMQGR